MPELTALYSPTINSYKRYVPGVWAPLTATWGIENRTCAIRVIAGGREARRALEYRQTAADINPYIAIATCLAAGLYGIENADRAAARRRAATRRRARRVAPLPRTLERGDRSASRRARARARSSATPFVDHYVRTREWEVRQYERAVTEWELKRYFEAI